jgi:tetratricopeptide (TPR) repeat protein
MGFLTARRLAWRVPAPESVSTSVKKEERMSARTTHRLAAGLLTAILPAVPPAHAGQCHEVRDRKALDADPARAGSPIAPLLEGLGDHHHAVTTRSERAQRFFDQGLKLDYAFNHQEALRAFKEAARLDPDCAMAYWGWALVLGPNLNMPMKAEAVPQAYEAIRKAMALRHKVSAKERAYIEALAARYTSDAKADRAPLDAAYADAMKRVHEAYPEDTDAATLYASAVMNLSPWNYWTRDGRPRERTPDVLAALASAVRRDPKHEGALHYQIHALEAGDPEAALPAADALRHLAPGAGHLVHMASHIYMQLGRYADAFDDNRRAALADEGYLTQCRQQGVYPLTYYPHNIHFLVWAGIMQGRAGEALAASRKVADQVPADFREDHWALYQTLLSQPLYVMARFAKWDAILVEPQPAESVRFHRGMSHWARGLAFVHTNRIDSARAELLALARIQEDPKTPEVLVGYSNAAKLLTIAREVLAGELAAKERRFDEAVAHLDRAVRLEDSLAYGEPPDWYYPTRHNLGAALIDAGRAAEAEVVYWQDLRRYRDNGFALAGLALSLRAQGRTAEAEDAESRYRTAWSAADAPLASSRF